MAVSVTIEPRAETRDHLLGLSFSRQRQDHVVLAVEHIGYAGEPGLHHRRRGDAVARAHTGKVERLLDVIFVARPAPQTRHLLRGVRQRESHALLVETRK